MIKHLCARERGMVMTEYSWSIASAIYQVQHGGPTHRTLSAIEYLHEELKLGTVLGDMLLEALVETRGLEHLGEALAPLPDDTETVATQE